MGTDDRDISSVQTLLTVARWHLDASVYSAADAARRHRERARHTYDSIRRLLSELTVSPAEREEIEREISSLLSQDELDVGN